MEFKNNFISGKYLTRVKRCAKPMTVFTVYIEIKNLKINEKRIWVWIWIRMDVV